MLRFTTLVLLGVVGWGGACCSVTCPDGKLCSDFSTCCMTKHGYACCSYPQAVCCSDMAHCCPAGFQCNLETKMCEKGGQLWVNILPMLEKVPAEDPSAPALPISPLQGPEDSLVSDHAVEQKSSAYCDRYYVCPDRTTCCRHPAGTWFCCPYYPGRCCLDGYHCCPYGYDCDLTYTHCVRQSLRFPFSPRQAPSSFPASRISDSEREDRWQEKPMAAVTETHNSGPNTGSIRCNDRFYCPGGKTCCQTPAGQWGCCPYPLGQCCTDGVHCCEYGYTCSEKSMLCSRGYSQVSSRQKERAKEY
ncbi:progranulin-like [Lampris incognitus]|uniref:progranulin-like n=1 Tax=Lampris incognitus TaxID=2546036 RepID=UPI0024B5994F|nr:progranulin-like [Lampris incognitus]